MTILLWILLLLMPVDPNPTGTVKINGFYVDKTEVCNIDWLEYVYFKKFELPVSERHRLLPDSANTWFLLPGYRYYPIVLITYDQAVDFCKWRSKVVSLKLKRKVRYRLPTVAEWQEIAGHELATYRRKHEKDLKKAMRMVGKKKLKIPPRMILRPSPWPDDYPDNRIYDLFNNVSEMTAERGIAMGPNNLNLTTLVKAVNIKVAYESADMMVGFRCIAEFVDE